MTVLLPRRALPRVSTWPSMWSSASAAKTSQMKPPITSNIREDSLTNNISTE